jgi:hypothetical protein
MLALLAFSSVVLSESAWFTMPPPPHGAQVVQVRDKDYYSGVVYLENGADTMVLKPLGFRAFEFQGRSVSSVRFHALWPKRDTERDSLPPVVSGLEYDIETTDTSSVDTPDLELPGHSEPTPDEEPAPTPTPPEGNN